MSFHETIKAFEKGAKTVTRREGWLNLQPGTHLDAVDRLRRSRRAPPSRKLGVIEVLSVRREPLNAITPEDVVAEGFPDWTPEQFVAFYCEFAKCTPDTLVTRIEFRVVEFAPARTGSGQSATGAKRTTPKGRTGRKWRQPKLPGIG